jgi:two-component system, OmpR family, response regulator MtrA
MKKILIVDDDPDIRDAITTVLKSTYQIQEAGSGDEAKKRLGAFQPDLVILDVMMETSSTGFELARLIKKSSAPPKILMLTGVDKEMNIDYKAEAGNPDWLPVDDYLTKPVMPKILIEKVRTLIG